MTINTLSIHVDPDDGLTARGEVQDTTGVTQLSITSFAVKASATMPITQTTTLDLYLYGDPEQVWKHLDAIMDACVDAKRAVADTVARTITLNPDPLTVQ